MNNITNPRKMRESAQKKILKMINESFEGNKTRFRYYITSLNADIETAIKCYTTDYEIEMKIYEKLFYFLGAVTEGMTSIEKDIRSIGQTLIEYCYIRATEKDEE